MTTAQLVIVCVAALLGLALAAATAARVAEIRAVALPARERAPELVGATVVVHTRKPDDQSVKGIVLADYVDQIVLRDAEYVHATGNQSAGGTVRVDRPLSSLQVLTPAPRDPTKPGY